MHIFEQVVKEYKHNELILNFKSMYSDLVMTTSLYKLGQEASKIFIGNKFKEVKK